MKLYLDDDCTARVLVQRLRKAGHDVRVPAEIVKGGEADAVHFWLALDEQRTILTRNIDDFEDLHNLILKAQGHHGGVLVIRKDANPRHDLGHADIVRTIAKLEAAKTPLTDQFIVLNHWR